MNFWMMHTSKKAPTQRFILGGGWRFRRHAELEFWMRQRLEKVISERWPQPGKPMKCRGVFAAGVMTEDE